MNRNAVSGNLQRALESFKDHRYELFCEEMEDFEKLFLICESPIEQLLFLELAEIFETHVAGTIEDLHIRGHLTFPNVDRFSIAIRQQQNITTFKADYRADFLITIEDWDWNQGCHIDLERLIVELDGHDYHERTNEQATRDKSRDRAMTRKGFTVFRFTGSEVYNDPASVAAEIEDFLLDKAHGLIR